MSHLFHIAHIPGAEPIHTFHLIEAVFLALKVMSDDTFINYTHPDKQADRSNRQRVAHYIGTHYRNRSGPASRRVAEERARQILVASPPTNKQQRPFTRSSRDEVSIILLPASVQSIPRDHSGLRVDPFTAFPIRNSDAIAPAVDYCKYCGPKISSNYQSTRRHSFLCTGAPHSTRGRSCRDRNSPGPAALPVCYPASRNV